MYIEINLFYEYIRILKNKNDLISNWYFQFAILSWLSNDIDLASKDIESIYEFNRYLKANCLNKQLNIYYYVIEQKNSIWKYIRTCKITLYWRFRNF